MQRAKIVFLVTTLIAYSFFPNLAFAEEVLDGAVQEIEAVEYAMDEVSNTETSSVDSAQLVPVSNSQIAPSGSVPTAQSKTVDKNTSTSMDNSTPESPEPIKTLPSPVVAQGEVLVSAFKVDPQVGYAALELYNSSDNFVDLESFSLELRYSTTETDFSCTVNLRDYLRPKSYFTLQHSSAAAIVNSLPLAGCALYADALYDKEIIVRQNGEIIEAVRINNEDFAGQENRIWERKSWKAANRTGVFKSDFRVRESDDLFSSELYYLPDAPSLQFLEILPNPKDCATNDLNISCKSYIKVKNTGEDAIDLADFRLRSGSPNSRDSANNVSRLGGVVAPGEIFLITGEDISINKTAGTVWLQDKFGLTNYENNVTPYEKATNAGNTGRSWAYDSQTDGWRWATPNPTSETNDFTTPIAGKGAASVKTLKPCRDDQYRSEETGRCRNITQASTKKPCKEGQYRSEETGRCRSIASAVSTKKPCAEDQFRNPLTGRCKKIASADDLPKPCKDGWERNPQTNRCRKIKTAAATLAKYPVEPTAVQPTNSAIWWTVGGLAVAGVAYGVWEWRTEFVRGFKRITRLGRRK